MSVTVAQKIIFPHRLRHVRRQLPFLGQLHHYFLLHLKPSQHYQTVTDRLGIESLR